VVTAVERFRRVVVGTAQWASRRPVTAPALPRLALSNWTRELPAGNDVRRRVMVTALRNRTWIEWAVYAACQLRRLDVATTLVFSGSEVRRLYPLARARGLGRLGFWAGVENIPQLRLIDLDDWRPGAGAPEPWREFARCAAPSVAAYDLRVEENEEGPLAAAYRQEVTRAEESLAETGAAMERILDVNPVARLVCYSGLIGRSPAVLEAARHAGVEALSVEGWAWRPGHMVCNLNAPALEYDVLAWLKAVGDWDARRAADSARLFRFQEGAPAPAGPAPGLHRVQRTASTEPLPPALAAFLDGGGPRFLLAPNVVGDSSTLRRPSIFRNQRDWLRQVVAFFRTRPELKLVVRAHPDEAVLGQKVVVKMGEVARELAGGAENVFVIGGEEDVSSYALLPGLSAGLVWISSIGADMVARGVPVLAAARPKYHALGFVEEPSSVPAYFEALARCAATRRAPTREQRTCARQYLDVVFSRFSFDAFSPSYRARDLVLTGPGSPSDNAVFYRIVAGDLPPETPPGGAARAAA
jgi:hypothetical protein